MTKVNYKKSIKNIVFMTVGALLYSAGIAMFLDPNQLAPGGVVGISIIVNFLTGLETGTVILLINIPLMLLAWWKLGLKMIISTMYVTVLSSLVVNYMATFGAITNDLLLAAVAGSALVATGMVLIFMAGATSGGTDILVKIIKLKYRHASTGSLFLMIDSLVVIASMMIFGNIEVGLYAALSMIVFTVVFDKLLYGADGAKLAHIISDKNDVIGKRIMDELEVGITYVHAVGGYTGNESKAILCAIKKPLLPRLQDIVKETDPMAFLIISSATEVYGYGHKDQYTERM